MADGDQKVEYAVPTLTFEDRLALALAEDCQTGLAAADIRRHMTPRFWSHVDRKEDNE